MILRALGEIPQAVASVFAKVTRSVFVIHPDLNLTTVFS
jgi:hypothetical protein